MATGTSLSVSLSLSFCRLVSSVHLLRTAFALVSVPVHIAELSYVFDFIVLGLVPAGGEYPPHIVPGWGNDYGYHGDSGVCS
jgi:hypothetical protein